MTNQEDGLAIAREQFKARITRLRMQKRDAEAVYEWLHCGGLIDWRQFQAIDPRRDMDRKVELERRARVRKEQRNAL